MMRIKKRWIALFIIAGLALALYFSAPYIGRYVQKRYFISSYQPEPLTAEMVKGSPGEYHLSGVPWISYRKAYCVSASLQMISHYMNREKVSLGRLNFLMGFTYGASYIKSEKILFIPYTDPEPGLLVAAPYLGLERKYYITDDDALFIRGIEFFISSGFPVRVPVNAAVVRGEPGFFPHSEVIVGYDDAHFYYYETGLKNQYLQGEAGIQISKEKMISSIADFASRYRLPWRYSLTIFNKGDEKYDLTPIISRNGKLLSGASYGLIAQGSYAVSKFASSVEKLSPDSAEWDWMLMAVEMMVYTRKDDASFLRDFSSHEVDLKEVTYLLSQAGESYQEALKLLRADKANAGKAAALIREGAEWEKKAGEFLKGKGKE
jgi:hypothetical protein